MKKWWLGLLLGAGVMMLPEKAIALTATVEAVEDVSIDMNHPDVNMNGEPENKYDERGQQFYVMNRRSEQSGTSLVEYAMIKFDLGKVPKGVEVKSAKLKLFEQNSAGSPARATYTLIPASGAWSEGQVTWANKPGEVGKWVTAEVKTTDNEGKEFRGYREWEIASLVQGWVDEEYENHGLFIKAGEGDNWVATYRTKETSYGEEAKPKLVVDYEMREKKAEPKQVKEETGAAAEEEQAEEKVEAEVETEESNWDLEGELAQVLTAKNLKIAGIVLLGLFVVKMLLK